MKKTAAFLLVASTQSHAGYGSMGSYESGADGGDGSIGDMVLGALLIGAVYWAWKKFF